MHACSHDMPIRACVQSCYEHACVQSRRQHACMRTIMHTKWYCIMRTKCYRMQLRMLVCMNLGRCSCVSCFPYMLRNCPPPKKNRVYAPKRKSLCLSRPPCSRWTSAGDLLRQLRLRPSAHHRELRDVLATGVLIALRESRDRVRGRRCVGRGERLVNAGRAGAADYRISAFPVIASVAVRGGTSGGRGRTCGFPGGICGRRRWWAHRGLPNDFSENKVGLR